MAVPQTLIYLGGLRCTAKHTGSGVEIVTDAPVDNMGKGESFSPTDLMVTALASCILTTMAIFAQKHHIELEGTEVFSKKHMASGLIRKISRIDVQINFCAGIPVNLRGSIEEIAGTCPAARSLSSDIEQVVAFHYPQ